MLKLLVLPTRLPSHVFFGKPTVMAVYFTLDATRSSKQLLITASCFCALLAGATAFAQDPVVDRVMTSNLGPGQKASATVHGKQLAGAMSLWTPVGTLKPKEGTDLTKDQPVSFEGEIKADATPGIYPVRVVTNHGCSEAAWVVVDDLPSVAITAEADDRKAGQLVVPPCSIGGQINSVVSKFFRVAMKSGQPLSIDVFARRLGSDLDPVLRVYGPDGAEVAFKDDIPGAEGDAQLHFTAAIDGEYRIEVRDVRYSGGGRHFFHLRLGKFPLASSTSPRVAQPGQTVQIITFDGQTIGAAQPQDPGSFEDFLYPVSARADGAEGSSFTTAVVHSGVVQHEAEPNDARDQPTPVEPTTTEISGCLQVSGDVDWFKLSVLAPTSILISSRTREVGSPCDLKLELYKPDGGLLAENDDVAGRDAELAAQLPVAGDYMLKVTDIANRGGPVWNYALEVFNARRGLRITAPADRINVPRGGSATIPLTVRRINYDGSIHVRPVNLPPNLSLGPFTIGSKQSTVPVTVTAADATLPGSDNDVGPINFIFTISSGEGESQIHAYAQLAPPPPKKNDNEPFRSARLRNDLFVAVAPAAQFSFVVDQPSVTVTQGMSAMVTIKSTRAADWTMPIEIALATPADQLPPGVTVTAGSMAAGELAVTINAAADAAVGPFTVFLQGKAKKDNVEPIHPVPPIVVEVKAP